MNGKRVLRSLLLLVAVLVYCGFALRNGMLALPQTSAPPLRFEAATIKPFQEEGAQRNARGGLITGGSCHGVDDKNANPSVPLGRCVYTHQDLSDLILQAFPRAERLITESFVSTNPVQPSKWASSAATAARIRIMPLDEWVTGGPGWVKTDFFNVEAKAEDPSTATVDQLRQMLQALLKEQFKLASHMAPKEVSGYFIIPAKGGVKLQKAPDTPRDPSVAANLRNSGVKPFAMSQGPLDALALILTIQMKAPVVNQTGIDGVFDYTVLDGIDLGAPGAIDSDTPTGSIFTAFQEKLGLKLEPHKLPVQIFAIDHAEKPSGE